MEKGLVYLFWCNQSIITAVAVKARLTFTTGTARALSFKPYKELWSVRECKAVADHGLMTSFAADANQIRAPGSPTR